MALDKNCEDCWESLSKDLTGEKEMETLARNSRFKVWVAGNQIFVDPLTNNGKRRIKKEEFLRCCERAKNNLGERRTTILYGDICKLTSSYCASLINRFCFD